MSDFGKSQQTRVADTGKAKGVRADMMYIKYGMSRVLYRIAMLDPKKEFVLKGGCLHTIHDLYGGRSTSDIDIHSHEERMADLDDRITNMLTCTIYLPDGGGVMQDGFEVLSVKPEDLQHSGGMGRRYRIQAKVGGGRCNFHLDIGFGGTRPHDIEYLEVPNDPKWKVPTVAIPCFPMKYVAAEKLHAVQTHGASNTRVRDYYDLARMWETGQVRGADVLAAVIKTWMDRDTEEVETAPFGLSAEYAAPHEPVWNTWHERQCMKQERTLAETVALVRKYYAPILKEAASVVAVLKESRHDVAPRYSMVG